MGLPDFRCLLPSCAFSPFHSPIPPLMPSFQWGALSALPEASLPRQLLPSIPRALVWGLLHTRIPFPEFLSLPHLAHLQVHWMSLLPRV